MISEFDYKNDKEKIDYLQNFPDSQVCQDGFHLVINQFNDKNDRIRFWGIDVLIKKFHHYIKDNFNILAPKLLNLLIDTCLPVNDRTIWAINIGGEVYLKYLLKECGSPDVRMRMMVINAIGKNWYAKENLDLVLDFLIENLNNTSCKIRYEALISLFKLIEDKVQKKELDEKNLNTIRLNAKTTFQDFLNRKTDEYWKDRYSNVFDINYKKRVD